MPQPAPALPGELVTESFEYDGGRQVSVYVPKDPPKLIVSAASMPSPLPRTYLVAGAQEPFFLENARRWASALRDAGADVVMTERAGSHGGAFWREELPLMVAWAAGR